MFSPFYLHGNIYTLGTKLFIDLIHSRNWLGRTLFVAFGGHFTVRWLRSLSHSYCELDSALGLLPSSHSWQNNSARACIVYCSWTSEGTTRWILVRWFVFGNCALCEFTWLHQMRKVSEQPQVKFFFVSMCSSSLILPFSQGSETI